MGLGDVMGLGSIGSWVQGLGFRGWLRFKVSARFRAIALEPELYWGLLLGSLSLSLRTRTCTGSKYLRVGNCASRGAPEFMAQAQILNPKP